MIHQLALPLSSDPGSRAPSTRADGTAWLGIAVDHWQLMDALQDEWLRPPAGSDRRLLGICAYAGRASLPRADNRIAIQLQINPRRLPRIDVLVRREGRWSSCRIDEIRPSDEAITWSGPLPVSAVSALLFSTNEERARLASLVRQVPNVALPDAELGVRAADVRWIDDGMPSVDSPGSIALPATLDGAHGALAMAVWAVPRIDPWLDLLVAAIDPGLTELAKRARAVDAPWWTVPPWLTGVRDTDRPLRLDERLWLSAIELFRGRAPGEALAAEDVVRRLSDSAARGAPVADAADVGAWAEETNRILRAEGTIRLDDWKAAPVGKAIQLVLARPAPGHFKTWLDDLPDIPPAIWWSAATLCGLLHGYRRLEVQFRGSPAQRRLLAIRALYSSAPVESAGIWPDAPLTPPTWRRRDGHILFSWGGEDIASKNEHARGQWFAADMANAEVRRAAEALAKRAHWPCTRRYLVLVEPWMPPEGQSRIPLPEGARIEEAFDVDMFLRCIATEGGFMEAPPVASSRHPAVEHSVARPREPFRVAEPVDLARPGTGEDVAIPGLLYLPDFLSEAEEREIVARIDGSEWQSDLKRRVQHYGWRYNYKERRVDESMRLGPLPEWAAELGERLFREQRLPHLPDQVIVNEYVRNQGISKHVDCPSCFADGIAMVSLLESWEMIFRLGDAKETRMLDRRSLVVIRGDARYRWQHEIPARIKEPNGLVRGRRISVTFRKVTPYRA